MPLKLLLGPANTRKVGALLDAHAGAAAAGRDAWLVVPSGADVLRTQRELAGIAPLAGIPARTPAPFGQVMAAPGLLRALLQRTGAGASLLTQAQRLALARAAIRRADLQALAPAARGGWLAGQLVDLAAELTVTGDLDHDDPGRQLAIWSSRSGDPRGHELARLLREDHALRRAVAGPRALGALDEASAALLVGRRLAAGEGEPRRLQLVLSGFDDLDPVQLQLVGALARCGAHVLLSLPFAEGRAALTAARGLRDELEAVADEIEQLEPEPLAPGAALLTRVERRLYEPLAIADPPPAAGPDATTDASVLELRGGGPDEEAALIAEHVAASLASGQPPEAIAIVTANPGHDGPALVAALARCGVAAHVAAPLRAGRAPSIAAALALLAAAGPDGTADDLATWLSGPGGPDPAKQLDAAVRRQDARTVADALRLWRRTGHDEVAELRTLRTEAEPREGGTLADVLAGALRERAGRIAQPEVVGLAAVERDLRAVAHAITRLQELAALAEAVPDAAPTVSDLAQDLEQLTVPAEPEPPGSIAIVDPLGIRTRVVRVVIVARAQRGSFPAQENVRQILAPADRGLLTELGWPRPRRAEHDDAERYRAYEVVARATDQLVLAWHDGDGDGGPCEPSPLLAAVARAAAAPLPRRELGVGEAAWHGLLTERAARLRQALDGPRHREPTHQTSRILAERVRDHYAVGSLQKAARCPAAWFVEDELRPQELSPDAAPLTAGRLRHDLLRTVVAAARDGGVPLGPPALPFLQQALRAAAQELAPVGEQAAARETLHEQLMRRRVVAEVAATLPALCGRGELAHQPYRLELAFGQERREDEPQREEASAAPVTIQRAGVELPLAGRIDRLDRSEAGELVVIDYKGPRVDDYRSAGWVAAKELQAGLYALAAEQLAEPGDHAVASLYQPVPGAPSTLPRGAAAAALPGHFAPHGKDELAPEAWDELLDELARLAGDARRRIDAGDVSPAPGSCGDGCRYPWLCRALELEDDDE